MGWRPSFGDQLALGARDLLLALDDVHRDPDRPRLVRDAALHGLADPPGRIGGELEALAVVELLDRPDQPDDPLLDQVEQRQAVPLVALGDRDDQPQVRVDHQILGFLVAALDPLGELDLLLGGQQLVPAGLVQEQLQRVGGRVRELMVVEGGVVLDDVPAVVAELDPALVELLVDARELVVVEVELMDELVELRQVDAALLLRPIDQRCQPVHQLSAWRVPAHSSD